MDIVWAIRSVGHGVVECYNATAARAEWYVGKIEADGSFAPEIASNGEWISADRKDRHCPSLACYRVPVARSHGHSPRTPTQYLDLGRHRHTERQGLLGRTGKSDQRRPDVCKQLNRGLRGQAVGANKRPKILDCLYLRAQCGKIPNPHLVRLRDLAKNECDLRTPGNSLQKGGANI